MNKEIELEMVAEGTEDSKDLFSTNIWEYNEDYYEKERENAEFNLLAMFNILPVP